ncbi:MAG TPA: ribulose-phosphate 3-epimerase [Candidatus Krumholzibacteria bacterium]|nr:ribulose-phosphate 3-epimerase [Candidatus Krumholzibacteria bacterium]
MSWWQRAGADPAAVAVAPSILAADAARLGAAVEAVDAAGADLIHLDVMDGHFVDNITLGPHVAAALRRHTRLPLDCHLMVTDPADYAPRFADAGADSVSFHWELETDHVAIARRLREGGCRPGLVVNPRTDIGPKMRDVLGAFDLVLVMSVHPGFGGQAFDPSVLPKLQELARWREEDGLDLVLEIDGGINADTAPRARAAGAQILVAGSAVFGGDDPAAAIAALRSEG